VYFCCNGCPSKFTKDPAKYVANLEKQGYPISAKAVKTSGKVGTLPAKTRSPVRAGFVGLEAV
jgi:hypothetical protein